MMKRDRDTDLFAFPPLPSELRTRFGAAHLALRSFGQSAADQEIDFQSTSRPDLETEIVAVCTQSRSGSPLPDQEFFWNLEIGTRTECLLTLATWGGAWDLEVELNCLESDCQAELDLDFSLVELSQFQRQVDNEEPIRVSLGGQRFTLRRPTGMDQLTWRSHSFPDESSAVQALIRTLLPPEQQDAFQQAWAAEDVPWVSLNPVMAQQDPLVNLTLTVGCPVCGALGNHSVDVGALALQRLRAAQDRLIETVHRLASHYHWTEPTIFALPGWRRDRYLALIERSER